MEKVVELMQQQIALQERRYEEKERRHEEQMKFLQEMIADRPSHNEHEGNTPSTSAAVATPNFTAFDSNMELWSDYWSRFCTFANAHSVSESKKPKVFLTSQTATTYKMLSNLAA